MPLASLRCRSARFDDERLNQKVKIATLKKFESRTDITHRELWFNSEIVFVFQGRGVVAMRLKFLVVVAIQVSTASFV